MHLLSEGQIKCFCFRLETDTAASTLLRLLKPRLSQIFPHRDVDMWGVFEWAVLGGVAES